MPRTKARRSADAALAALYDSLPRVECRGLGHHSCGPIAIEPLELLHMEEAHGGPLPLHMPAPDAIQAVTTTLLGAFRLRIQKRGIAARDCRPLGPGLLRDAGGPEIKGLFHFRLGAWVFTALIAEDPALDCWAIGIGVAVDPDAIPDAD